MHTTSGRLERPSRKQETTTSISLPENTEAESSMLTCGVVAHHCGHQGVGRRDVPLRTVSRRRRTDRGIRDPPHLDFTLAELFPLPLLPVPSLLSAHNLAFRPLRDGNATRYFIIRYGLQIGHVELTGDIGLIKVVLPHSVGTA